MLSFDQLVRTIDVLTAAELEQWIELRWVVPERRGAAYYFREVDRARVELLCDIRHRLAINEEAVPVVLSLLDQVYGLRRELRRLGAAITAQPEPVRRQILAELARDRTE